MHIIQISPEAVPFAKTGGLADVVGAIPYYLEKLNHRVSLFLPLYKQVKESSHKLISTGLEIKVPMGGDIQKGLIWRATSPRRGKTNGEVYFIQRDEYYHRDYLYSMPEGDYPDNAARFIFFSRGVLEAIKALELKPDIIHCHDWQTALVPVYLKTLYPFKSVKTVLTIHNLAYQGLFPAETMNLAGLDWSLFNWRQLEFWGKLGFLKGGLVFADALTTVSPTYAQEIQTREFGYGLEGVLKERSGSLYGIINGVDYADWNPDTDKLIPANYTLRSLKNKTKCKKALQKRNNLPEEDLPLIGMVTRLADQKGLDLVLEVFNELMKLDLQFVLLGTGEEKYHQAFREVSRTRPDKAGINIAFDNQLAHLVMAGADIYLMPSRYEPCGLNQLYALKYGTIPVVRQTGGLADTIKDSQNGFVFSDYTGQDLLATIKRALVFYKDKKAWQQLVKTGMNQDWSWKNSAREYHKLYLRLKE